MQHRPCVLCIYRTLIQQRLLVEFSYELPTRYPTLRDLLFVLLLVFVTSGCHNIEINPNGSLHLNSLMLLTWYPISTSHILPSLVLSHCPDYAVTFVLCLCTFLREISFINFLVYSVCLFSVTFSFHTLFRISFQNFQTSFHFNFLISLLTYLNHRK